MLSAIITVFKCYILIVQIKERRESNVKIATEVLLKSNMTVQEEC